ncbi:MAG: hypothetical protein OEN52_07950 [Gammaproteobacteria bacterium]|nr:hypothetical protein [Gammaproteobacteria bacterium]
MQDGLPMTTSRISRLQKCIAILWPSFLTAIVATGLFFSAFDPDDLIPFGADPEVSRLGIYTIGFFLFWLITAVSGIGTLYFAITNCMRQGMDKQVD